MEFIKFHQHFLQGNTFSGAIYYFFESSLLNIKIFEFIAKNTSFFINNFLKYWHNSTYIQKSCLQKKKDIKLYTFLSPSTFLLLIKPISPDTRMYANYAHVLNQMRNLRLPCYVRFAKTWWLCFCIFQTGWKEFLLGFLNPSFIILEWYICL